MLKQRLMTAAVLLAVLLPTLFAPWLWPLAALATAAVIAGAWEWGRLLGLAGWRSGVYACLPLPALVWSLRDPTVAAPLLWWVSAAFWMIAVPLLLLRGPQLVAQRLPRALRVALGVAGAPVLLPACWVALLMLRINGVVYLLSVLVLVWAADSGAYFAGKRWGRHKLAPTISPGKSREGAVGGWLLVLALAFAATAAGGQATLAARLAADSGVPTMVIVVTALVGLSIAGDLFESLLKRAANVKDSSALLPGHGGVLDRIDALLPVLPLAALLS